jgi:nucleotide-binding universal stress UspA family protein
MAAIVVGVDTSDDAAAALAWAATEARHRGATLVAVHAYWVPLAYVHDDAAVASIDPELREQAERTLEGVLEASGPLLTGLRVVRRLHPRVAAQALIDEAAAADLLVVGRRGAGGFKGLLLGSTAEHCARQAQGPVVVVQAPLEETHGRVVVGVDGSTVSERALAWAVARAEARGATLEVVSVYETYDARGPYGGEFMRIASPAAEQRFRQRAEQCVTDALAAVELPPGLDVEVEVTEGHPVEVLLGRARQADLVVTGSRGLGGITGLLLGSVSRQLLHHAECPVAVVR